MADAELGCDVLFYKRISNISRTTARCWARRRTEHHGDKGFEVGSVGYEADIEDGMIGHDISKETLTLVKPFISGVFAGSLFWVFYVFLFRVLPSEFECLDNQEDANIV